MAAQESELSCEPCFLASSWNCKLQDDQQPSNQRYFYMNAAFINQRKYELNISIQQVLRAGLSYAVKNTQKSIEIDSCWNKNANSFRLRREGAHPPPVPTLYGQQSWPSCTALPWTIITLRSEHPLVKSWLRPWSDLLPMFYVVPWAGYQASDRFVEQKTVVSDSMKRLIRTIDTSDRFFWKKLIWSHIGER